MSRTGDMYLEDILSREDSAEWAREQRDRFEGPMDELEAQGLEDYQDILESDDLGDWWEK